MPWQAPRFTEIDMNAEIGAYQRDPLHEAAPRRVPRPSDDGCPDIVPPDADPSGVADRR